MVWIQIRRQKLDFSSGSQSVWKFTNSVLIIEMIEIYVPLFENRCKEFYYVFRRGFNNYIILQNNYHAFLINNNILFLQPSYILYICIGMTIGSWLFGPTPVVQWDNRSDISRPDHPWHPLQSTEIIILL